ncbi:MAG: threonine--tRNA ligase [Alphaproteobacteria bacterium]|jgi:threonyl-tRNA synthetase|nr:threonine--tRNA ligase [Thalassospira sp.]MCE2964808.1 threonine--tRNA ligase [Alphaproteobacteria bacterium]
MKITFPDGAVREYPVNTTGLEIAESISKSLAKSTLAVVFNGEPRDSARAIDTDGTLEIVTKDHPAALEIIRHDAAHIMAEAVQELFPGTQVTIGPAIENGFYYDFYRETAFTPDDLPKIEQRMRDIVARNEVITREVWERDKAIAHFNSIGETFKAEIIQDLPGTETITLYRQGKFADLCRGPHLPSTHKLGTAFKLTKLAGSYWRGDHTKAQLQRIYGTAWATQEQLDAYLKQLEEAEKRDHRKLGREMDLFHFQDEAPGSVFWHPKGWTIYQTLIAYMRRKITAAGYVEVNTPQMLDATFWQKSGHWDKYRENMFVIPDDHSHCYAMKPMSCPGNIQLYKAHQHSYRDLPIRMAEFGQVFRREASGARHGLMRVQAFTQDDAHIFCRHDQLEAEVIAMCTLMKEVYTDLGLADSLRVKFSTRPEQRIGSDEDWDRAEAALQNVCNTIGLNWTLNAGDGAFYAPKLDFVVTDAIGRDWQCGTIQVDMNLPHRLGLSYVAEDGSKQVPHMVHRAILGSLERFIGVLLEHYAGNLPLWLAPVQVVLATITDEAVSYAENLAAELRSAGVRVVMDVRNEKISYKVREHSVAKVPLIWAVGKNEMADKTVAVRRLGSQGQETESAATAVAALCEAAQLPA